MSNSIVPLTLGQANAAVAAWHRRAQPVRSHRFSIGLTNAEGQLIGAAIMQRPVSSSTDQYLVIEVARCAVDPNLPPRDDGHANSACSRLYAACARVAKEMGFHRIQTFTATFESGTTLRAAGWTLDGPSKGDSGWHRRNVEITGWSRQRSPVYLRRENVLPRQRWSKVLVSAKAGS